MTHAALTLAKFHTQDMTLASARGPVADLHRRLQPDFRGHNASELRIWTVLAVLLQRYSPSPHALEALARAGRSRLLRGHLQQPQQPGVFRPQPFQLSLNNRHDLSHDDTLSATDHTPGIPGRERMAAPDSRACTMRPSKRERVRGELRPSAYNAAVRSSAFAQVKP